MNTVWLLIMLGNVNWHTALPTTVVARFSDQKGCEAVKAKLEAEDRRYKPTHICVEVPAGVK